jgi:hypothetical protein
VAKREEITEGGVGSGGDGPLGEYKQSITMNLGNFSSLQVSIGVSQVSLARVKEDMAAFQDAVPIMVSVVDSVHGDILAPALGTAQVDEIQAKVLGAFVKALEGLGKK